MKIGWNYGTGFVRPSNPLPPPPPVKTGANISECSVCESKSVPVKYLNGMPICEECLSAQLPDMSKETLEKNKRWLEKMYLKVAESLSQEMSELEENIRRAAAGIK